MILPTLTMLLVIITWLGWQAIYSSVLSYQSTLTSSRMTQQFLVAEQTLFHAEHWLATTPAKQLPPAVVSCSQTPCILIAQPTDYYPHQPPEWWQTPYPAIISTPMNIPFAHQSYYVIEHLQEANTRTESYYRITAWALLEDQTAPSVLQSVWKKSIYPALPIKEQRYAWRRW